MAHELICDECKRIFRSQQPNTMTCSSGCRFERSNRIYGRRGYAPSDGTKLSTGTTGAITEMVVAVDLMKKGYAVFRALSPACFCDLVAYKDGKTIRVECRTGYRSSTGNIGFQKEKHGQIDLFAVVVTKEQLVSYFESDARTITET